MKKSTKFGLSVLAWMFSSFMYLCGSWYLLFILKSPEDSLLFLALLVWMCISGGFLLYMVYVIAEKFVPVLEDES